MMEALGMVETRGLWQQSAADAMVRRRTSCSRQRKDRQRIGEA
ncbi:MAG: hypothetical protein ACLS4Z_03475 [Christensenellaceae bacterium]